LVTPRGLAPLLTAGEADTFNNISVKTLGVRLFWKFKKAQMGTKNHQVNHTISD
jgi:hypothetical protein